MSLQKGHPGDCGRRGERQRQNGRRLSASRERPHHELARAISITVVPPEPLKGYAAVVCAGTSDIPVAEEAAVTCECMGTTVKRVYDVGVAGIVRLLALTPRQRASGG